MANRQFGLGKGLAALIPEPGPVPIEEPIEWSEDSADGRGDQRRGGQAFQAPGEGGILRVGLSRIEPNPDQPRKNFSEESIAELAASIRLHGLIQPIIVEAIESEGAALRYRIVAGERRWRAAGVAALKEIPVIVRSFSKERRLEVALIENVQREDLNPIEEAEAYRGIMELTGCTQEDVADKVGKSRPAIANALRLLRLTPTMLAAIRDGNLSPGHARALLAVADPTDRELLFARVIAEELSVRQAEAAAQEFGRGKRVKGSGSGGGGSGGEGPRPGQPVERRDPDLVAAEGRLIEAFGTKVSVRGDFEKGTITIEYYSMEDLERILEKARGG
ncbi:MAG: ParB/RepB/Spo0J family partition protein [Rectinemataceae bacterium]